MSTLRSLARRAAGSGRPRVVREPVRDAARRTRLGNYLIGGQLALIVVCLLPVGPTIGPGFPGVGLALVGLAAVVGGLALLSLGRSARVHPIPGRSAYLHTNGMYAVVRHPMYAAVLLACAGVTVAGARVLSGLALAALAVLLHVKARFEDRMLSEQYGWAYAVYAQRVPSVLPWPRPREPR